MSRLLFSLDGRIGIKQFWIGLLSGLASSLCLAVIVGLVLGIAIIMTGATPTQQDRIAVAGGALVAAYAIYTQLAVVVKRCHDQGRSGWWCLLSLIPIIGPLWLVLALGTPLGSRGRQG